MNWFFRNIQFFSFFLFAACVQKEKGKINSGREESIIWKTNKYAQGFKVGYGKGYKVISISDPWQNKDNKFQYLLFSRESDIPSGFENALKVKLPLKSIAVLSSLYVAYIEKLGLYDYLKAVGEFKHINSPTAIQLFKEGKVEEVGSNGNVNIEKLIALNPDLVITYGSNISSDDSHPKLLEAGLKVPVNIEQMENTPLGRAEWIKFMAVFFDKEKQADSIFNIIEQKYLEVKKIALNSKARPSVFVGIRYGDIWYMPGGNSYAANLLKDANSNYLWEGNKDRGSQHLSFEEVYKAAGRADFWINTGDWKSLSEILTADNRYGDFNAFTIGNVYNNNKRLNEFGGNDYWESGIIQPNIVLADLIKIFHPELLPDHKLVYYKKLH